MKNNEVSFKVIIPVRFNSTRLPGKPLMQIAGKPMIWHVYMQASKSKATNVIVATDDKRISECCEAFGAKVCMTSSKHTSGSDRIAEVAEKLGFDKNEIILNVQGDEPLISPEIINELAKDLFLSKADTSTVCEKIETEEELDNPNVVKVVLDKNDWALYFSRSVIPYSKSKSDQLITHYRHRGIYAYKTEFLLKYINLEQSEAEKAESLEQLRILHQGYKIHVIKTKEKLYPDINTKSDLKIVNDLLKNEAI